MPGGGVYVCANRASAVLYSNGIRNCVYTNKLISHTPAGDGRSHRRHRHRPWANTIGDSELAPLCCAVCGRNNDDDSIPWNTPIVRGRIRLQMLKCSHRNRPGSQTPTGLLMRSSAFPSNGTPYFWGGRRRSRPCMYKCTVRCV